ncbi:SubName: Full=Uncharacterized protein {ECO:0000313/EMBL:CCA69493.1} [Serendipita indica DSM 11827]|uniref:Transmembrane protein n=1 Tax=Serendipita indica (strain DSM 11827) TaxID=1109443 RepID=G4TDV7_SERID|nr:SubName: Full=Uncharacterized protein {ECO:0000313/EMBL:CCA69493.1} [Serendipita indica DSM 11827]CCA69493.1 hypothetical protein PIIN_03393 [Serendipita indica DSM 11827]
MHVMQTLSGRRHGFGRLLIVSLAFAPTALSSSIHHARNHREISQKRSPGDANALDLDLAAVFPQNRKRLLGEIVGGVGNLVQTLVVGLVGGGSTTVVTTSPLPTSVLPTSSTNVVNNPAPAPTSSSSANGGSSPSSSSNSQAAPAPTTPVAGGSQPSQASSNPTSRSSTTMGGTVFPINLAHGGSTTTIPPQVVTDHQGNLHTITAPLTRTYLTTLPNGVVSTVTEVITPTDYVGASGSSGMSPGKIAAVVGTLVTVFLIVFGISIALLILRKRRKASQRARPTSASSFGSVSDEWAHDARRNSQTALVGSNQPSMSASVAGTRLNFPLPPAPAASPEPGRRPNSMVSNQTFDLAFEQQKRSRDSIIEDKNALRKIGQYPDAGTYTPFAFPPSDQGHTEENGVSPTQLTAALEGAKSFHAQYRLSRGEDQMTENPFSDPAPVTVANKTQQDQYWHPLPNQTARQTGLWRKATFGSDAKLESVSDRSTLSSFSSAEYGTATSHHQPSGSPQLTRMPSVSSDDHYSYHSAMESYANHGLARPVSQAHDPFADPRPSTAGSAFAARPGTSGNESVVSSVYPGGRELGPTPDPVELFYQRPTSMDDGERTIRARSPTLSTRTQSIIYPTLTVTRAT